MLTTDTAISNLLRLIAECNTAAPDLRAAIEEAADGLLPLITRLRAAEAVAAQGAETVTNLPQIEALMDEAESLTPDLILACRTATHLRRGLVAVIDGDEIDFATNEDMELLIDAMAVCLTATLPQQPGLVGRQPAAAAEPQPTMDATRAAGERIH